MLPLPLRYSLLALKACLTYHDEMLRGRPEGHQDVSFQHLGSLLHHHQPAVGLAQQCMVHGRARRRAPYHARPAHARDVPLQLELRQLLRLHVVVLDFPGDVCGHLFLQGDLPRVPRRLAPLPAEGPDAGILRLLLFMLLPPLPLLIYSARPSPGGGTVRVVRTGVEDRRLGLAVQPGLEYGRACEDSAL